RCRQQRLLPVARLPLHVEGLNGPLDVFERQAAQIVECRLEAACDGLMNAARNHYAASWRLSLQASCYVHPISIKIVSLDDDVAEMQADSEDDRFGVGTVPIHVGDRLLEFDRRRKRIDGARELDNGTVTHELHHPAAEARDRRLETLPSMLSQARQRS